MRVWSATRAARVPARPKSNAVAARRFASAVQASPTGHRKGDTPVYRIQANYYTWCSIFAVLRLYNSVLIAKKSQFLAVLE
jgi:hypothetical protein